MNIVHFTPSGAGGLPVIHAPKKEHNATFGQTNINMQNHNPYWINQQMAVSIAILVYGSLSLTHSCWFFTTMKSVGPVPETVMLEGTTFPICGQCWEVVSHRRKLETWKTGK